MRVSAIFFHIYILGYCIRGIIFLCNWVQLHSLVLQFFQLLDENVIFLPHKGAQEINEIFSIQFINSTGENIEVCNFNQQEF